MILSKSLALYQHKKEKNWLDRKIPRIA